jgi:hypothetical protein
MGHFAVGLGTDTEVLADLAGFADRRLGRCGHRRSPGQVHRSGAFGVERGHGQGSCQEP